MLMHLTITQHAVDRYRERFRELRAHDRTIVDRLRVYWGRGERVYRTADESRMDFARHGFVGEWRMFRSIVMIVNEGRMVTVMRKESNHKPRFVKRAR